MNQLKAPSEGDVTQVRVFTFKTRAEIGVGAAFTQKINVL